MTADGLVAARDPWRTFCAWPVRAVFDDASAVDALLAKAGL
ncbi:hypothetical protein [Phenylobacterium sp.]|nr:hypothetical protein [Phenylobacterium sp.]